jgi:hypothetical protein
MTPAIFLIALAAAIPTVDPHKTCRAAESEAVGGDQKSAYESCVRDEQAARDQINVEWGSFQPTPAIRAPPRAPCRSATLKC